MLVAPSFQTYFGIDPNDKTREAEINGSIVCVLQIGCLFGSLMATSTAGRNTAIELIVLFIKSFLDALGRKYSIMMAAFVFTIGGIFQIIGYSLEVMYTGRVISGLGI
jgi:SP family sugar:H+ symporter-like MFS transporter